VELYAEICEVFLGKRKEAVGLVSDLAPKQKQRVLQPLAYHMMCHNQREITGTEALGVISMPLLSVKPDASAEDFLKMIENTSGLLLERESGSYGFAHKTFQEYLASVHVLEEQALEPLISHVEHDWWHETIRLYCAQIDASPIIAACLDNRSAIALTLAIECIGEAREVNPAVRQRYQEVIEYGVEDPDPQRRRVIAEALLASRLGSADAAH
jgi:predicted NACHT family NTPase